MKPRDLSRHSFHELPLLTFPDSGRLITTSHLATVWGAAVIAAGIPPERHSLHCIRKTAATMAANMGASEDQIKDLGLWKSAAYQKYVKTHRASAIQSRIASAILKM